MRIEELVHVLEELQDEYGTHLDIDNTEDGLLVYSGELVIGYIDISLGGFIEC